MNVLWYEVGYDISNVLGSGTEYHPVWRGKSEAEAIERFNQPEMTYLCREIKENGRHRTQYYDQYAPDGQRWLY